MIMVIALVVHGVGVAIILSTMMGGGRSTTDQVE
jgi:hypothetical protein